MRRLREFAAMSEERERQRERKKRKRRISFFSVDLWRGAGLQSVKDSLPPEEEEEEPLVFLLSVAACGGRTSVPR